MSQAMEGTLYCTLAVLRQSCIHYYYIEKTLVMDMSQRRIDRPHPSRRLGPAVKKVQEPCHNLEVQARLVEVFLVMSYELGSPQLLVTTQTTLSSSPRDHHQQTLA